MIDDVQPVPGVALAELAVLVVAPAPGLPGLVHHDHVARVLAAAHVSDPRALQRRQPHRLVDVVLGVVAVLLQLAGLQGLTTFMLNKIQLIRSSVQTADADRKYLPKTHILPLRGAAEQHHTALGVQLSLLGLCRAAVGPILCRSLGGFHGNL